MRVLMVSHFYESHLGGIERVAGHVLRQMAALGAQVEWAASAQDTPPQDIACLPLPCINPTEALTGLPMPIPGPRGIIALWCAVGRAQAVVVHDALYVTSILALAMARMRGRPVVLIQHIAGIPFASALMRGVMALANALVTRPMLAAADRLVFISDTVRRDLLGEAARRDYSLLFNGVDAKVFNLAGVAARPVTAKGRLVLFVGRFVEKKGLSILREVARRRPEDQFLLAGAGPVAPQDWGLPNVHVLGPQSASQLAALYRGADVLLLPSVGEGYPLVIQEAMACGLPVICGAPTHLADPEAGAFLQGVPVALEDVAGSALRVAQALEAPLPDGEQRAAMAAWAAARYDWRAMAGRILELAAA
jgi:starch synthase